MFKKLIICHNITQKYLNTRLIQRRCLQATCQRPNKVDPSNSEGTTHFGFQTVKESEKEQKGRFNLLFKSL